MQVLAGKSTNESPDAFSTTAPAGGRHEKPAIAFEHAPKSSAGKTTAGLRWGWVVGGIVCLIAALILFGVFHSAPSYKISPQGSPAPRALEGDSLATYQRSAAPAKAMAVKTSDAPAAAPPPGSADSSSPMIARTVSLTIQVKDISGSRSALDAILARYQGYAAELTINTPENAARSFSASLRIPAPALMAALDNLRKLGRVQNESQAGEEVTQQHADLVARLKNARETERRLVAILQQRTGKVEEVLQVEEQISITRGEIERMEAEQKALEHRVDFATVQLQLAEEFKAQLNAPSASAGTRVSNAFVNGLENAGSSILGILLFLEEYGPALLVWFVVLGTPAWLVWRRYRRAESRA